MTMSFFPVLDNKSTSGRRVVWNTSRKTSLSPKPTSMFKTVVPSRIDIRCAVFVLLVSPDLIKANARLRGCYCSSSSQTANSLRTESCLHLYLPCVSVVKQDDMTCSSVPGLSHRLHLGSTVSPHRHRFALDSSSSQTDLRRKENLPDISPG